MHILEMQTDNTDSPICRAAKRATNIKSRLLDSVGEGKGRMI